MDLLVDLVEGRLHRAHQGIDGLLALLEIALGDLLELRQRGARQVEELRATLREREQSIARLQSEASQLREKGAELHTRLEEERQQAEE
ncbi:MAG TPA: hypothetical protein VFZ61_08075, partial [Polyangiales bacterium]